MDAKILFCTSECTPFITTGGLGDVAGSLPGALCKAGVDCRVVLPLYGDISPEYRARMKYITNFQVPVAWRSQYCGLFKLVKDKVTYYFLDNEYFFKRSGLYGFYDDGERFAFFSRAILEMLCNCDFAPDIIHCNDWQTALTNVYINAFYRDTPKLAGVKTLFTIHNIEYQGKYGLDMLNNVLGLGEENAHLVEYNGCVNYMKGAIECSDKVSTVSPTYSREILDPWYGQGLDGLLRQEQFKLSGILNGIDTDYYNPAKDTGIAANFSPKAFLKGKAACKSDLNSEFGLDDDGSPIIAIVSRLADHKGIDLVNQVLEYILLSNIHVVVLGSGEYMYENCFRDFAAKYPTKCGVRIGFDSALARKIYAGSDMFLMPSKSEPCGLSQLIALRYGTVPIVRVTGGLADTIRDCGDGEGNGFTFLSYNSHDMLDACLRAKSAYENKDLWKTLVLRALNCDFSWKHSAQIYKDLYDEMLTLW